jgi:hypothetical protein
MLLLNFNTAIPTLEHHLPVINQYLTHIPQLFQEQTIAQSTIQPFTDHPMYQLDPNRNKTVIVA